MRTAAATILFLITSISYTPSVSSRDSSKDQRISFVNIAPGEAEGLDATSFSAKIAFSSESGIPYGGVYVRVFNASGIAIFKQLCEKPWLYLRLPAGDYHVVAIDRKKIQRVAPFAVKPTGNRMTVVKLKWPKKAVGY